MLPLHLLRSHQLCEFLLPLIPRAAVVRVGINLASWANVVDDSITLLLVAFSRGKVRKLAVHNRAFQYPFQREYTITVSPVNVNDKNALVSPPKGYKRDTEAQGIRRLLSGSLGVGWGWCRLTSIIE